MYKRTLALLFCLFFSTVSQSSDLDIKGVKLGMTLEEVKALVPSEYCGDPNIPAADHTCVGNVSYGGASGKLWIKIVGNKVTDAWITVDSESFDSVAAALKEKYGKPTKAIVEVLQNAMGARFINSILIWTDGNVDLNAMKYSLTTSESTILLVAHESDEQIIERNKRRRKENANDL